MASPDLRTAPTALAPVRSGPARTGPAPAAARAPRAPRTRSLGLGLGRRYPLGWSYGLVLLLLLWWSGSTAGLFDPRALPAPQTVVATLARLTAEGELPRHLQASMLRAAAGFAAGAAAGLVLAVVSGLSRLGEALIDGPVQVNRATPGLAMMPLLILWFGIGEDMKVITIALGVMVPIYLHTHTGLRAIDARWVELAEIQGLGRWGFLRHVVLPGALPGVFLGLRFAVLGAWLALIVVEQYNATEGIGYMMTRASTYGQTDVVLGGLVVYAVLGLLLDGAVRALQRAALRWRTTLAD